MLCVNRGDEFDRLDDMIYLYWFLSYVWEENRDIAGLIPGVGSGNVG